MRTGFLQFLAAEGTFPQEQLQTIQKTLRRAPEPIGSIAFSYGMVSGTDIDLVLDAQRSDSRPFGEIAISRDLLTREQVETLLGIQPLRAATEAAEALALSGLCPLEEVMQQLGSFLLQTRRPAVAVQT